MGPLLLRFQLCWVSLCGFILLVRSTIDVPFGSLFFPLKISAFMSCFVLFYDVVPLFVALGYGWLGAKKISFFGCFCVHK
jgi:hypothetical protein